MNKYIEVKVTETVKEPRSGMGFDSVNQIIRPFDNMAKAIAWIEDRYAHVKTKSKIMQDRAKGGSEHVGTIYHYRNADLSHSGKEWMQEDWVLVYEIDRKVIKPAEYKK